MDHSGNPDTPQEDTMIEKIYDIADSISHLALKLNKFLYVNTAKHEQNLLFSPINMYSALALLHLGADDTGRDELADAMGLQRDKDEIQLSHETIGLILETIQSTKPNEIHISKQIFVQQDLDVIKSYKSQVRSFYGGKISSVNFQNDSDEVTNDINRFISKGTKNAIQKYHHLPITSNTSVLFASSMYFKAKWSRTFYEISTQKENFNTGSNQIPITMMTSCGYVPYIDMTDLQFQSISLRFFQSQISIFYLLPYPNRQLEDIVLSLDHATLQLIVKKSQPAYVDIKIPKMKYKCPSNIKDPLAQLAIKEVFSGDVRLNMVDDKRRQFVRVIHAAEMEIDQSEMQPEDKRPKQETSLRLIPFHADRPFLFFVYDHLTRAIFFLGAVHNPNADE